MEVARYGQAVFVYRIQLQALKRDEEIDGFAMPGIVLHDPSTLFFMTISNFTFQH